MKRNSSRNREILANEALAQKPIKFTIKARKYKKKRKSLFSLLKSSEYEEIVEKRDFFIYPCTLGKMSLLTSYFLKMDFDEKRLQEEPMRESMRVCLNQTDLVCETMAIAVLPNKEDIEDEGKVRELKEYFKWNSYAGDYAGLLLTLITMNDYVGFTNSIRLTEILRLSRPTTQESESQGTHLIEK